MAYDPAEQDEIVEEFVALMHAATQDGAKKRMAGKKVSWKIDTGHEAAFWRHVARAILDPDGRDEDSGASHWVAIGWRAFALAWQVTYPEARAEAFKDAGFGA